MAGHGAVLHLCRALAEQNHAHQLAAADGPAARAPLGASRTQVPGQLLPEHATRLHEQRLVAGLVGHAQIRIVRMLHHGSPRDLLRQPARAEQTLDDPPQPREAHQLR